MSDLLSFHEDGWQWAWDATSLSNFVACPRLYQLRNLLGWKKQTRSVHLIFGGHYAKALERFHKLRAENVDYWEAARIILRQLMIDTWDHLLDEKGERIPGTGKPCDWMHNTKTRDTLIRSVIWYLHHFENDTMETVILKDGRAAVELSFTIELTAGSSFVYCGHQDRLVRYAGETFVQDQKTSGSTITPKFFRDFSPDYQMTGYTLAGQIIYGGPITGVSIDAAQIAVGFTEFTRGMVMRAKPVLEEFREEVLFYASAARDCHRNNYFPMNRKSCHNYGGCEFQEICSAIPAHREALLAAGYERDERWDPLKRR